LTVAEVDAPAKKRISWLMARAQRTITPRDATRGGVNVAACRDRGERERPLSIDLW